MEFLFGLIAVVGLGAIFYVTVHKKTRAEFTDHIKAAEVVMTEVQQEILCIEETAKELAVKVEEIAAEVAVEVEEIAAEIAVEVEEIAAEIAVEVKEVVAPVKAPKTPKAAVAEKRTRKSGKFVGDDKSTTEVNEAYKDGKKPAKSAKSPTKPKASKPAVKKKVKPS